MIRSLLIALAAAVASLGLAGPHTAAVPPDEAPPKKEGVGAKPPAPDRLKLPTRKEAMAMKLKAAQAVLEGIALNDFEKVQTAADNIVVVSNATDFLNAYKGPEYQFHVELMRRPAEMIGKKAKDKNMDGVMVAYNDLTLSCLKCHQAMRDKKFEVLQKLEKLRDR